MKINVIITGATGMVGRGVLLECLESPEVGRVLAVLRSSTNLKNEKLQELVLDDFYNLSAITNKLAGYDACFFCLGVSALGMNEAQYSRITHDLTMNFAKTLFKLNKNMVFNYVSGTGTDSSGQGRIMWARVKGRTENNIFSMNFRDAYAFRPGLVIPEKDIRSRTSWYNGVYMVMRPFFPLLKRQSFITTTSRIGKAMIRTVLEGYHRKILENKDINLIANQ